MRFVQTAAYYVAFTLLGMTAALLGPTINNLAVHAKVDLATISVLFTAYALGYLTGSLLSGRMYDRMRGAPVMAGSVLLLGGLAALMPTLNSIALLVAAQVILGIAGSGIDVGGNTLLVWTHGKGVGPYMNALHLMFGVGALLAPYAVTLSLTRQSDVHLAYWIIGAAAIPAAIFNFVLPSPSAEKKTGDETHTEKAATAAKRKRFLSVLVPFFFMIVAGEASMSSWLFNYAHSYDNNDAISAQATALFWGAFTFGRLIAIPIAARVSPGRILLVNTLLCVVSMVVMIAAAGSGAAFWAAVALFGFGMAPLFATAIAFAEQHIVLTGSANSLFLAGASLSSMTVPLLIGRYFESAGPVILPIAVIIVMVAAFIALLAMYRLANAANAAQNPLAASAANAGK